MYVCLSVCVRHRLFLRQHGHGCALLLLLLLLCANGNVIVSLVGIFHRGELGLSACHLQWVPRGEAMAVLLQGPHFLPGERRVMSLVTAQQGSPLSVVSPHLQNGLFERPSGQGVQDRVKSAIDGENKYDDPGADGACSSRGKRQRERELKRQSWYKVSV